MPYKIPIIIGATIASIAFFTSCGWLACRNHMQHDYDVAMRKANDIVRQKDIDNAKTTYDLYQKQLINKDYYNSIYQEIAKDEIKNIDTDVTISAKWMQYTSRCSKQTINSARVNAASK